MKLWSALLLTTLCLAAGTPAAGETALSAIKALPEGEAQKLLRIEATDGRPAPKAWRLFVRNPQAEHGLREYVVSAGEIVASHEVGPPSSPVDSDALITRSAVKIDSDKVSSVAMDYALANNVDVASMSYELQKSAPKESASWKVTCFAEDGAEVGELVLSASRARVMSREGFPLDPPKAGRGAALKFKPLSSRIVGTGKIASVDAAITPPSADDIGADATGEDETADDDAGTSAGAEPQAKSSSGKKKQVQSGKRNRASRPSSLNTVRRVTNPVRRVIRKVLPF